MKMQFNLTQEELSRIIAKHFSENLKDVELTHCDMWVATDGKQVTSVIAQYEINKQEN